MASRINPIEISVNLLQALGAYIAFCGDVAKRLFRPRLEGKLVLAQMEAIGVRSFWIILMASFMIGAVFAIQFGAIFRIFGAESLIGAAASFALSKELAPVISSFLVTGRSGSAMAAEIATMKVNEQIDALKVMAVNPVSYLVAPRVLACMVMVPLLTGLFTLGGILSCYYIGVQLFQVDEGIFLDKIKWLSKPIHVIQGLEKAVIFGAISSTIGCYKGFQAKGGAKGVGVATTQAVVYSLVTILVSDFFISYFQLTKLF